MALFQPISLKENTDQPQQAKGETNSYVISNDEDATISETRFQCRFKLYQQAKDQVGPPPRLKLIRQEIIFSQYPFNYEYIKWRKKMDGMLRLTEASQAQISSITLILLNEFILTCNYHSTLTASPFITELNSITRIPDCNLFFAPRNNSE